MIAVTVPSMRVLTRGMVRETAIAGQQPLYTGLMDASQLRAEQLLTLSSAARRISDLVAAAEIPLRYEIMRHMLRVSEETMTEVLEEAVHASLVKRGPNPFTYVPHDEATGAAIRDALDGERLQRLRDQITGASKRVLE